MVGGLVVDGGRRPNTSRRGQVSRIGGQRRVSEKVPAPGDQYGLFLHRAPTRSSDGFQFSRDPRCGFITVRYASKIRLAVEG